MSSKKINTTAALETAAPTWWIRPGLEVTDKRMKIAGYDAETIAREYGTPPHPTRVFGYGYPLLSALCTQVPAGAGDAQYAARIGRSP
jgi:hypothetical protein